MARREDFLYGDHVRPISDPSLSSLSSLAPHPYAFCGVSLYLDF